MTPCRQQLAPVDHAGNSGVKLREAPRPLPTAARQTVAPSVSVFATLAALVLAQQVAGKVLRDALFLAQASAAQLPRVLLFGALLSAPVVLGAALLSTRIGPRRVAAACFALNAGLFAVEYALLPRAPLLTAWLVYLHIVALGGTTLSSFFANVAEYFDPHSARQASVRVTSGAAVGGALGGLAVSSIAQSFGYAALLPGLALLNLVCAVALSRNRLWPATQLKRSAPRAGLALSSLARSRYVRSIAYLVILTQLSAVLLDFNFKRQAAESLGSGASLVQLLTAFYTATSLITTLVQLSLTRFALDRLGLAGTLSVLPLGLLFGGALGPLMPRLWAAVGLRGISSVLESSLFRSAYEPLYTPLSQRARRSLKTLIDVAAGRIGEALGSVLLLGVGAIAPNVSSLAVRSLAFTAAGLSLLLSLHMHSRYVDALTSSLRKGSVRLRLSDALDSTTRLTLSQTHIEIERAQLLADIAAQRAAAAAREPESRASLPPVPVVTPTPSRDLQLTASVADLLSRDPARIHALLAQGPLDPRLISFAIPLLEHPRLTKPVSAALSGIVDRGAGQLADALLDPSLSPVIRRRLPKILQLSSQPLAAHALSTALQAPERVLRYRAATALVTLSATTRYLQPAAATVFACVQSEIKRPPDRLTLRHIFMLLSLALEREPLWLAYNALRSGDDRERGTALEYLHSTLPEPLRGELVTWAEVHMRRAS